MTVPSSTVRRPIAESAVSALAAQAGKRRRAYEQTDL
jgi:hypothetical protein